MVDCLRAGTVGQLSFLFAGPYPWLDQRFIADFSISVGVRTGTRGNDVGWDCFYGLDAVSVAQPTAWGHWESVARIRCSVFGMLGPICLALHFLAFLT